MIVTPPPAATAAATAVSLPTPTPTPTLAAPTTTPAANSPTITIGSQNDTEQLIVGQMLIQLLQASGYHVTDKTGLGGPTAVRTALEQGQIDLAIAHTSTTLTQAHQLPAAAIPSEAEKALTLIRTLDEPLGLTWLAPAAYHSQTVLVVTAETRAAGLVTLDDLARYVRETTSQLRLCTDSDFYARQQTGLHDLAAAYSFTLPESSIHLLAAEEVIAGLTQGQCDVAVAQNNDSRLQAWELHPLQDTRAFFPLNTAAPVIRSQTLAALPELERPLNRWGIRLDSQTMHQLITRAELGNDGQPSTGDEETPAALATAFLHQAGLLGNIPQIVISSLPDPANQLLAALTERLLQENGYSLAPATSSRDLASLHAALQNGGLDLAWLYSHDALREFYAIAPPQIPPLGALANAALAEHSRDTGLYWLEPSHISQRNVVFVNGQTAVFTTINQLAEQINRSDTPPTLCTLPDFYSDPDGLLLLFEQYGFTLPNDNIILAADSDDLFNQVITNNCQIGIASGQNGRFAPPASLHTLADPLEFFPNYTLTPVIRQEIANAYPQIASQLQELTAVLTPSQLNRLLARTQLGPDGQPNTSDEDTIPAAAELFLCEASLLAGCQPPTTPAQAGTCRNLIINGDFEQQTGWNRVETAVSATYTTTQTYHGNWAIQLGSTTPAQAGANTPPSSSSLSQQIQLPAAASSATLTYWHYPISQDTTGGDIQSVVLYDETFTAVQQTLLRNLSNEQTWLQQTHDVTPFLGQTIFLYFGVVNDGDSTPSLMFLDNVALELCD